MLNVKLLYRKIFPGHRYSLIPKELSDCESVLDLGCGPSSPVKFCNNVTCSVGVDLFGAYIEESQSRGIHNRHIEADIREIEFEQNSFDAVIALEVLEHLTKEDGRKLLKKMEKCAKKKIIITTTNGYAKQEAIDGNEWQIHRSGWHLQELKELGFQKIYGIRGWIKLRKYIGVKNRVINFLTERAVDLTQKIIYYFPSQAHRFFAVKYIKE